MTTFLLKGKKINLRGWTCSQRQFAKLIGVSAALVNRLWQMGLIRVNKYLGVVVYPSLESYLTEYLPPEKRAAAIERILGACGK